MGALSVLIFGAGANWARTIGVRLVVGHRASMEFFLYHFFTAIAAVRCGALSRLGQSRLGALR